MRRDFYPVIVVDYDTAWPAAYRDEADRIRGIFGGELVDIHHVGGTSIPDMFAKPIIDILPIVREIEKVETYNDALANLGYAPRGEYGVPGRRYFVKAGGKRHTHHVHVFESGNPEIERLLLFRDFLIHHEEDAAAYAELKRSLAEKFPNDAPSYTEAKSDFVLATGERARAWRDAGKP